MAEDSYEDYVEARYQGEVFGETFMAAMAAVRSDPDEVRKLRALEQLERETKELLRPAVLEAGRSTEPDEERVEQARTLGAQLGRTPWRNVLEAMRPELVRFVEAFRKAESLAPAGKEALLRHVTAHEQALLDFTNAELSDASARDSLRPVTALLQNA